jgi:hypothetical protein
MPAVTRSGPQSQPKLQAILRSALNGCGLTCGRGPSPALARSAAERAAANVTVSRFAPGWSTDLTGNRYERCMFCVRASGRPFSATVATVSSPSATRSIWPSSGLSQVKRLS